MRNITEFINELRKCLLPQTEQENAGTDEYIDLASMDLDAKLNDIHLTGCPKPNPVLPVFEIILGEISLHRIDRIRIGLNELLKFYLVNIDKNGQLTCQEMMYRVELIFKRCLLPDFPYADKVWDYINLLLRNFCLYLLQKGNYEEAKISLDTLAHLGRIASQDGLPTAVTQSALRLIELKALNLGQKSLAAEAKNYRFNLEI